MILLRSADWDSVSMSVVDDFSDNEIGLFDSVIGGCRAYSTVGHICLSQEILVSGLQQF